ncbi:MAG: hypothetical protein KIT84_43570 [Labilithrix sp.]|nr:hypothetical protein [Labilithrix sp.]MCW5817959.1 hypothetical protein [Labilithrix sp.]
MNARSVVVAWGLVVAWVSVVVACSPEAKPPVAGALEVPPMPAGWAPPREVEVDAAPAPPAIPDRPLSYDEALAIAKAQPPVDAGPKMSDRELSEPLRGAKFVGDCGAPHATQVRVRLVVHDGHAFGVGVDTHPKSPAVTACIEDAIRALTWPKTPHYDVFTTQY